MTNPSSKNKSARFFKTLSLTLLAVSVAAMSFIATLIITDQTSVAHGKTIAHPSKLNAEFFNNNPSSPNKELAQVGDKVNHAVAANYPNDYHTTNEVAQANNNAGDEDQGGQCSYLTDNLRIDFNNDPAQVYKLQAFLKAYAYDYVELTGEFGSKTLRAVQAFQTRHAEEVLKPWGYQPDEATGYVYITTRQKINEIYCNQELELSVSEQAEIANYRNKLNRWRAQGADFDTPEYLAQYRASQNQDLAVRQTAEEVNDAQDTSSASDSQTTNEQASDDAATDTEQAAQNQGTSTQTTSTNQTDSDTGFFAQLFGQGGASRESAKGQATSTTGMSNESPNSDATTSSVVTTSTSESVAAGTSAATSGLDQAATSVYSGVNSIVSFIFSPTFLLILLGVLILLLIATLLEDDEGGAYEDITADDFAKDFEGSENRSKSSSDNGSSSGPAKTSDEPEKDSSQAENDSEDSTSKTKAANFEDTPAADSSKESDDTETDSEESSSSTDTNKSSS